MQMAKNERRMWGMFPKHKTEVINNELVTFEWGQLGNALLLGWNEISRKPVHPEYKNKFPRLRRLRKKAEQVMKNHARLARGAAQ